jgi:UDP-N-acetylmuramoylalanine--D-glutamate ligase
VLELSSFQLEGGGTGVQRGPQGFEPSAAAVLNLTQDHLDWHGDMAAYAAAKARIFGQQGCGASTATTRWSTPWCHRPGDLPRAGRKASERQVVRFGLGPPRRPVTLAWWSKTAWPGWCVHCRPKKARAPQGRRAKRSTCSG